MQLGDPPPFESVATLKVDYNGDLIVVDPTAQRVHVFDPGDGSLKLSTDLSPVVTEPYGIALAPREIANSASVQSQTEDPVTTNNSASAVMSLVPAPVVTGINPDSAKQGEVLHVQIQGVNLDEVVYRYESHLPNLHRPSRSRRQPGHQSFHPRRPASRSRPIPWRAVASPPSRTATTTAPTRAPSRPRPAARRAGPLPCASR